MQLYKHILLVFLILFSASSAWGEAKLSIWPVSVRLTPEQKMGEIHLANKGESDANVQISAKTWDMDENGKFIETDTGDFVFYPRLLKISAGEEKTLRVGYNGDFPLLEKPYRVYIQELPAIKDKAEAQDKKVSVGFNLLLKLSVPLFVSPLTSPPAPEPAVETLEKSDTGLRLSLKNKGTHNFMLLKIGAKLLGKDKKLLAETEEKRVQRVLPHRQVFLDIPLKTENCPESRELILDLYLDSQRDPLSLTLNLQSGCVLNKGKSDQ